MMGFFSTSSNKNNEGWGQRGQKSKSPVTKRRVYPDLMPK